MTSTSLVRPSGAVRSRPASPAAAPQASVGTPAQTHPAAARNTAQPFDLGWIDGLRFNLSAAELLRPELLPDVAAILDNTALAPESLVLEITESSAMADPVAAHQDLH